MSTLYDAGTGIALIVRPPRGAGVVPRVYDELFSGVDLLPTLLGLLGIDEPTGVDGMLPRAESAGVAARDDSRCESDLFSAKAYHDSFDHARAIRTKEYSYIENYEHRPPRIGGLDVQDGSSVKVFAPELVALQPERELYDLLTTRTKPVISLPAAHG